VISGPRRPSPLDLGRVCLVVTGAPGPGKSTVTRAVAQALSRSARLDAFEVSNVVVSGHVWPLGEPADEAARQATLCHENLCALATNLMNAGFTPVVDVVVPDRKELDVFRSALGDRLRLVVLDPGTDVCVSRNAARAPVEQFFLTATPRCTPRCRPGSGISAGGSTPRGRQPTRRARAAHPIPRRPAGFEGPAITSTSPIEPTSNPPRTHLEPGGAH
jgi:predicted kinase